MGAIHKVREHIARNMMQRGFATENAPAVEGGPPAPGHPALLVAALVGGLFPDVTKITNFSMLGPGSKKKPRLELCTGMRTVVHHTSINCVVNSELVHHFVVFSEKSATSAAIAELKHTSRVGVSCGHIFACRTLWLVAGSRSLVTHPFSSSPKATPYRAAGWSVA